SVLDAGLQLAIEPQDAPYAAVQHDRFAMTVPRLNTAGRFDLAALFHPTSIAVIGAQSEAGAQIVANLAIGGFKGEVHTGPLDAGLPKDVSLAVLALPPDQIGPAMTALAEASCFAAI